MKQAFFIMAIFLGGCSLTPSILDKDVKIFLYVKNPVYGVVASDHPKHLEAAKTCKERVYNKKVEVDGELISDASELKKIYAHYVAENKVELAAAHKKSAPGSGAHAGAMAAIAVSQGRAYQPTRTKKEIDWEKVNSEFDQKKHPDHIRTIKEMLTEDEECRKNEFDWKVVRMDWVNTRTGVVVKSVDL